jgi:hypothetical protein
MMKIHNRLAGVVRRALIKFIGPDMRSEIRENQRTGQNGLPERLSELRPDMILEKRDRKPRRGEQRRGGEEEREREGEEEEKRRIIETLEFPCPYGCISHDRNTLEKTYEAKEEKYEELARILNTQREEEVRVTVVIVSSMGAVYGPSMKDLQKVLRCNDKEMKKLARQMSNTVILGSMEIWGNNAKRIERENQEVVNALIEDEEVTMEEARLELERGTWRTAKRESSINKKSEMKQKQG